ncbi:MAG TPA: MFS transporter [Blastocatellia bacterium]|nr:MFS transporter [Blastocatellia bacterium]HMX25141.1 MFS transporter [Blastocatellia bacterium]HMZ22217.1 MFS transporter [Blastocatellia bacterium]HNG32739.1 MFS transporter [Blastocatellia bacterium]
MQSATFKELLRENINFRRLWVGQVISELGTWFSFIAELGLVQFYSGSPWMTTGLLVSRLLPVLIFAPVAGVAVDRLDRRRILLATDIIRAVVALGFLSVGFGAPVWIAILCSGLVSSASTFFEAAKNASIANMVSRQEMLTANVLMFSTRFLQLTLGAALGGITAAKFGYNTAFVINALSFIASAAFIWPIPATAMRRKITGETIAESVESLPASTTPEAANHFWTDVREGLLFLWATPFVRGVVLVNVAWALGGGMNNLLFDRIARHEFVAGGDNRGDGSLAILLTAAGAGLFIGMALARRAGIWVSEEKRAGQFIGWSLLIHGLFFAAAGLMPSLLLFSICIGISRFILGAEFGVQETLMMRTLPDEYRGRVFTTDRALELSTMMLSTLVAGSMLNWFNPRTMIVVSGLLSASPGAVWLLAMWMNRFSVPTCAVRESYSET